MTLRKKGSQNSGYALDAITLKADSAADYVLRSSRQLTGYNYFDDIIKPPYEPKDLIALIERNDTLKQNIEALAANVANYGFGIKYQDDFDYNNAADDAKSQSDSEWDALRRLYKYLNPLSDFNALVYKAAVDMYTFGWGMLELIRNGAGEARSAEYCRACNFRLVNCKDSKVSVKTWEENNDGYTQVESFVQFKKFVQIVNDKRVYFKEFGDPRPMSCVSGEYGANVPENELATEIAYFSIHSSYSDYGVPYWINTAIVASGNIMSELLNYKYFQDGRILPMAITVSGGQLTESSAQAIADSKGLDNAYKALILEAAPFEADEEASLLKQGADPRVSIDVKSLTDTNNNDALFRNYQLDGKEKIRDSLRLPPIYTGAAADYNRATADTARAIAEEQIFVPERKRICNVFNKIINNELAVRYCELYLKGPDLSNTSDKANIISALNSAGAVTPNMLIPLAEEVLGKDIELWDEELGNIPFELLKLKYNFGSASEFGTALEKSAGADILDQLAAIMDEVCLEPDGGSDE